MICRLLLAASSIFASIIAGLAMAGCTSAMWTPGGPVDTGLGIAQDVAQTTGSPLLLGIVGIANALFAIYTGRKAAQRKDAEDWSADDIETLVEGLRRRGWEIKRHVDA